MKEIAKTIIVCLSVFQICYAQNFSGANGLSINIQGGFSSPNTLFKTSFIVDRWKPWLDIAQNHSISVGYLAKGSKKNLRFGGKLGYRFSSMDYVNSEFRDLSGNVNDFRPITTTGHYLDINPECHFYFRNNLNSGFLLGANLGVSLPLNVTLAAQYFDGRSIELSSFDNDFSFFVVYSGGLSAFYLYKKLSIGLFGNYLLSKGGQELLTGWSSGLEFRYYFVLH